VPDHAAVFEALLGRLAPGGQLAVQVPANGGAPFTTCSEAVAAREPFRSRLGGFVHRAPVEAPEFYVALLDRLGVAAQRVGTWHYPQRHERTAGLADFARGGLLSAYRARLTEAEFEAFVAAYTGELEAALGPGPLTFPFRRLFAWARRA
jgi:trans-aconitate 2-methyltransferase